MKKFFLAFLITSIFTLTSCSIVDKLGFDTYDYMSEEIVRTHSTTESEAAAAVSELLDVLISDSTVLPTFDNMNNAIKEYRDAVLMYMLEHGYSKYSGNIKLIEKAEKEYPEYTISQIIPVNEFEATMYRYFGGSVKITHRDGDRFKYLSKVNAYISPAIYAAFGESSVSFVPEITELLETEKTYRVKFHVNAGETQSSEYFALIIKREDGTLYVKQLLLSDVK